ncbi:hypothetical protein [Streptomyces sp. NPDC047725]|uniref:hypothetical protein n=1 Tax=Streptomyces sp. NPDC047725 TaxID=3365487 RepID=UPI003716D9F6
MPRTRRRIALRAAPAVAPLPAPAACSDDSPATASPSARHETRRRHLPDGATAFVIAGLLPRIVDERGA